MSSDSQPSFRFKWKNKLKAIKPNITLSIQEHFKLNETYNNIRETSRNLTNSVIDQTGLGRILNKTINRFPTILSSTNNQTSPKGFYDSLFSPQTEHDVYLKAAIICLWVIAMLCIISTIITILIPVTTKRSGQTAVRMIFLHIFLCEFFYLIYISLSMINVALDFQLNSFWCNIAKYGMYATIPVMYLALLVLSFERLTSHFNGAMGWAKIFTNTCVTQVVLIFIWIISIVIITIIIIMKTKLSDFGKDTIKNIIPKSFNHPLGTIFSPPRCSIDGQLLPLFKILFIILFIILIVLIIKSIVVSIFWNFFPRACCGTNEEAEVHRDHPMTLIFIIFLLLNFLFSFPFYFISTANSISTVLDSTREPFSMKLKLSFILRISSIILQCFIFYTLESKSWSILSKLLYFGTCEKFPVLNNGDIGAKKPTASKQSRNRNNSENNVELINNQMLLNAGENDTETDTRGDNTEQSDTDQSHNDDDDNNDVFIDERTNKSSNAKKPRTTPEVTTSEDDSDDETKVIQEPKRSPRKRDTIEKQNPPIEKPTSKFNNTNGTSKQTPNGKSISQPISSTTNDRKISKSNGEKNRTKYSTIPPTSSLDDISNVSVSSDDEVKPVPIIPKIQTRPRPTSNKHQRIPTDLPNEHRSHYKRHRTTRSRTRPVTTTSTNYNRIGKTTAESRRKSPRNIHNHTEKPKKDRQHHVLDNSHEV